MAGCGLNIRPRLCHGHILETMLARCAAQIVDGEAFANFHRRLVERVDAVEQTGAGGAVDAFAADPLRIEIGHVDHELLDKRFVTIV